MEGKRNRGKSSIAEDSKVDLALWELAEVLAEIAANGKNPAGSPAKHRPKDSTK